MNIEYKKIINVFSKNFIKGGLVVGLALSILEILSQDKKYVAFYALVSSCFIYVSLLEFNYLNHNYPSYNNTFLYYTVIGSVLWTIFALELYILHYLGTPVNLNILIVLLSQSSFIIGYFYLIKVNKITP